MASRSLKSKSIISPMQRISCTWTFETDHGTSSCGERCHICWAPLFCGSVLFQEMPEYEIMEDDHIHSSNFWTATANTKESHLPLHYDNTSFKSPKNQRTWPFLIFPLYSQWDWDNCLCVLSLWKINETQHFYVSIKKIYLELLTPQFNPWEVESVFLLSAWQWDVGLKTSEVILRRL